MQFLPVVSTKVWTTHWEPAVLHVATAVMAVGIYLLLETSIPTSLSGTATHLEHLTHLP